MLCCTVLVRQFRLNIESKYASRSRSMKANCDEKKEIKLFLYEIPYSLYILIDFITKLYFEHSIKRATNSMHLTLVEN